MEKFIDIKCEKIGIKIGYFTFNGLESNNLPSIMFFRSAWSNLNISFKKDIGTQTSQKVLKNAAKYYPFVSNLLLSNTQPSQD